MRTWSPSPFSFACGNCAAILAPGSPVLQLFVPGLKHAKLRCAQCAGEPVPEDLPDQVSSPQAGPLTLTFVDDDGIERPVKPMRSPSPLKAQAEAFDWRDKAYGGD